MPLDAIREHCNAEWFAGKIHWNIRSDTTPGNMKNVCYQDAQGLSRLNICLINYAQSIYKMPEHTSTNACSQPNRIISEQSFLRLALSC